ncbi:MULTISPECIES: FISUMP domain-containing protein [unclassified Fibrobacter]|uniref:FISUMP domain-containing protein n=1 Tax=unclassified Fibrobacter TaxID=2634177 RepID=UPI000D6B94A0|nr:MULTISPECIES: FISUMP domain-containing protein [unclassified Fibrobacter]PWJ64083.1 uncharacterized protein (TIGR02145 family) [Fibrobacter sp. UWR4]PZW69180.1 uncharacterized protein (TIGR02145 family) [Fibrobacter sp. UWR1]
MKNSFPSVILSVAKNLAMLSIAAIMLIACGGDNGSSAKDEDSSSSVADEEKSSSSTKNGSSSDKESSSSAKESSSSQSKYVCDIYTLADALSCKCDENREGKLSYNYDSNVELVCIHDAELNKWGWIVKKDESSSSSEARSSSSSAKSSSSSSVILSSSSEVSSSSVKSSSSVASSSSAKSSSSSVKSSSSSAKSSSSSAKSSSSSVKVSSSSSEYVPFDHKKYLAPEMTVGPDRYKQFTDSRNGRSYYYITITGKDTSGNANSVTVMAENLNIGEMIRGRKNQEDDSKIERYCYDNDTTNCDRYGGLYQWAEMMDLPSECNTKSCADQIKENHQGICPTGWRLLTYNDMYTIVNADGNKYGIEGVRAIPFGGYNTTGYSLVGAGYLWNSVFKNVDSITYWYYPEEDVVEESSPVGAKASGTSVSGTDFMFYAQYKTQGMSVRCVMVE